MRALEAKSGRKNIRTPDCTGSQKHLQSPKVHTEKIKNAPKKRACPARIISQQITLLKIKQTMDYPCRQNRLHYSSGNNDGKAAAH